MPIAANASATLPDKSAAQVIAMVQREGVTAFSGTIEQTSDLGLPSTDGLSVGGQGGAGAGQGSDSGSGSGSGSATATALEFLTGSHSVRIFVDGPKNLRAQVIDQLAERDVIRHGNDVWLYDSKAGTAEHATIPAKPAAAGTSESGTSESGTSESGTGRMPSAGASTKTPAHIAELLLAKLRPSSTVSVDGQVSVAGRSAYNLVLTPKSRDSLLGSVSIAVDSATGMPLRVQLTARGSDTAAVSVGFSSLTLAKPAASLFTFTPPKSATVKQLATPTKHSDAATHDAKPKKGESGTSPAMPKVSETGSGWDSVVLVSDVTQLSDLQKSPLFSELTTSAAGGRLLHTTLVNILFLDDGRIVAGSVPVAKLESAASAQ